MRFFNHPQLYLVIALCMYEGLLTEDGSNTSELEDSSALQPSANLCYGRSLHGVEHLMELFEW